MDWHAELVRALAVQEVDRRIDALRAEEQEWTQDAQGAELRKDLAARKARVATLEADLRAIHGQQRKLELERDGVVAERDRDRKRLYGGQVTGARELEGLQHNVEGAERRIDELETAILEAMEQAGQLQERLKTARARLERATTALEQHRRTQASRLQAIAKELPPLMADRERAAGQLDPEVRREYERLRRGARGIAISEVAGGESCSACGVALSTLARGRVREGSRPVTCENCGRLLVEI